MLINYQTGPRLAVVENLSAAIMALPKTDTIAIVITPTVHKGAPTDTLQFTSYFTSDGWADPAHLAKAVFGHLAEVPTSKRIDAILFISSIDFYRHNASALRTSQNAVAFIRKLMAE